MDFGYKAEEILWLVESGVLTLGYQSSSYLTDRVPELSFVDLPFLFRDNDHARGAMDGALGKRLVQAIESKCELPHPRLVRERLPPHLQPRPHRAHAGRPQGHAHPRAAEPDPGAHLRAARRDGRMIMDLTDAIRMIKAGEIDAQENPLTNTVTYGVHKFHRFHTISNHFYISRPIFLHRPTFDAWPADLKAAMQTGGHGIGRVPARAPRQGGGGRRSTRSRPKAARSSRSTPSSTTPSPRRCSRSTPRRGKLLGDELFKLI